MKEDKRRELIFVLICGVIASLLAVLVMAAPSFNYWGNWTELNEDRSPTFTYNFSANVSPLGGLEFTIENISVVPDLGISQVSDYEWISINSSTGVMTLNSTRDNETGRYNISIFVKDASQQGEARVFYFNVTAVNDAPVWRNLDNKSFNMSDLFEYVLIARDEEGNYPLNFNITFVKCNVSEWSDRGSNCTLFGTGAYSVNNTAINISFTPTRNDIGNYTINFSATDVGTPNSTVSALVNFSVLRVNSHPYFRYVCDNERNASEDSEFTCWINASDIDETDSLNVTANYTWFTFNETGTNNTNITCGLSTGYNISAFVNFTARDAQVGNWSVNISIVDTGTPSRTNSTVFWFFINNTEDDVILSFINDTTIYENKTLYVNATDDDLRVIQKSIKNEILSFASNESWVTISTYGFHTNYTSAKIKINFGASPGAGTYKVNISVNDTGGNSDSQEMNITIVDNNAPLWNETLMKTFLIYEDNETYLNLSLNATDTDGDDINFSASVNNVFPSFSIRLSDGKINFTANDSDVGQHLVWINASDGKLNNLTLFNFTVRNVNDIPSIESPLTVNANASASINSNITTAEDNFTSITMWVQDSDFRINVSQFPAGTVYNESINVSVNISGPNLTLLKFIKRTDFPTPTGTNSNRTAYVANFTPSKTDVGNYNVTINVTDRSNVSVSLSFNLTIKSVNHNPILMNLINKTSSVNRSFYYRINATDLEDGNSTTLGNYNLTINYTILTGLKIFNSTTFNISTGEINITFNDSQAGVYRINVSVIDTSGSANEKNFSLFVYGPTTINSPASTKQLGFVENTTSILQFNVSHAVGNNLTFKFYVNESLVYNVNASASGALNMSWSFIPNYTHETYTKKVNLTLFVLNPIYNEFNATRRWNATINHSNSPVNFSGYISDKETVYTSTIKIDLTDYFKDIDHDDRKYNQTVNFSVVSNDTLSYISWSVDSSWNLTLSSLIIRKELLYIVGEDLNVSTNTTESNATSNIFVASFIAPPPVQTVTSGGGSKKTPVALKIIVPGPISAHRNERIEVPIKLKNSGTIALYDIDLSGSVLKDLQERNDIWLNFGKTHFDSLLPGKEEATTLSVNINTNALGLYEITLNGVSKKPKYSDWGKIYLTIREANKTEVVEQIIFTEEFIAENPQCIEIKEMVDEAKKYLDEGKNDLAFEKARDAIDACKYAIAQQNLPSGKPGIQNELYKYLSIATLAGIGLGVGYYLYKRVRFRRAMLKT